MADEDTPTPTVAGHKQGQKEDLAVRITATLEAAGYLYDSIAFAEKEVISRYKDEVEKINEYTTNLYSVTNPIIRRVWASKINQANKVCEEAYKEVTKKVDPEVYRNFLDEFYMLWCATADQLDVSYWENPEDKEKVEKFIKDNQDGIFQPSIALEMYIMYSKVLANAGIRDLRTTKLAVGESV